MIHVPLKPVLQLMVKEVLYSESHQQSVVHIWDGVCGHINLSYLWTWVNISCLILHVITLSSFCIPLLLCLWLWCLCIHLMCGSFLIYASLFWFCCLFVFLPILWTFCVPFGLASLWGHFIDSLDPFAALVFKVILWVQFNYFESPLWHSFISSVAMLLHVCLTFC